MSHSVATFKWVNMIRHSVPGREFQEIKLVIVTRTQIKWERPTGTNQDDTIYQFKIATK